MLRSTATVSAVAAIPWVLSSRALGQNAPSKRITLGFIGVGRMGQSNLRDFLGQPDVQILAVCDTDASRAEDAKRLVEGHAVAGPAKGPAPICTVHRDFRELLGRPDIDAVAICTPDHWHGLIAAEAARQGKDIFLEKPLTLTLAEGRVVSDTVTRYGRVLATNTWQRSESPFRRACEIVRNGLIGDLRTITIGLPVDEATGPQPAMPVPAGLDYDLWLGPAPWAAYTEKRVHPRQGYDRPGWMRVADYCGGMITNWGAHHVDIAHWAMGVEHAGPLGVEATAEFAKDGPWDVHLGFRVTYRYPNNVTVVCQGQPNEGVHFEGTEGWVFVSRSELKASRASLLSAGLGPNGIRLARSTNHKRDFLDCIKSRSRPIADAEIGHRSCSACIIGGIAMQMARPLRWDAQAERFIGDDEANRLLSRPMRSPWTM
jgi:myo-inositol 2-dehydrogenase/D-chiro-inositol 1-dehydrogenase